MTVLTVGLSGALCPVNNSREHIDFSVVALVYGNVRAQLTPVSSVPEWLLMTSLTDQSPLPRTIYTIHNISSIHNIYTIHNISSID